MTIKTKPFDAAKYFTAEADQVGLIRDAMENGDVGYIAAAIGTVAKARGIGNVAGDAGLSRQALHKSLTEDGNPTLDTLVRVLKALNLRLDIEALEPA